MKIEADNVKEYLAALPEDRSRAVAKLCRMVRQIWPKATEDLTNGMPTYHLDGQAFCAVGNQKNFMALYIMPHDLLNAFNKDLKAYDRGRSCIRFRRLEEETLILFERILKYTGSKFPDSRFYDPASARSRN
ncbi:MAG: DUF1801 domain-containing protein [Flavobacteriales bacterium]|nr:DUF1801 domain-containing protein [Flavobacteriales bacterium]MCB9166611.1 DUF1801 domain-containing protein [Flavobacteriales bacterium]